MIDVYIPYNIGFKWIDIKNLFEKYKKQVGELRDFFDITSNDFFYSYVKDNKLLGCIYFYNKNDKLYMNAFASRHHHYDNLECVKMSLTYFNCDIYAEALHKESALCLLRCGFKRFSDNTFIYRNEV